METNVHCRNALAPGRALAVAGVLALTAACATDRGERVDERVSARLAQFEETGETANCLPMRRIASIDAATETKLLFRVGVDEYWLNETAVRCIGVTYGNNRIQYLSSIAQLCRNDIVRVVDNFTNINQGSCGLGGFKKLKRRDAAATD